MADNVSEKKNQPIKSSEEKIGMKIGQEKKIGQNIGRNPSLNTHSCIKGLLGVQDFCFWAVWAAGPVLKKKVGADYEQLLRVVEYLLFSTKNSVVQSYFCISFMNFGRCAIPRLRPTTTSCAFIAHCSVRFLAEIRGWGIAKMMNCLLVQQSSDQRYVWVPKKGSLARNNFIQ